MAGSVSGKQGWRPVWQVFEPSPCATRPTTAVSVSVAGERTTAIDKASTSNGNGQARGPAISWRGDGVPLAVCSAGVAGLAEPTPGITAP